MYAKSIPRFYFSPTFCFGGRREKKKAEEKILQKAAKERTFRIYAEERRGKGGERRKILAAHSERSVSEEEEEECVATNPKSQQSILATKITPGGVWAGGGLLRKGRENVRRSKKCFFTARGSGKWSFFCKAHVLNSRKICSMWCATLYPSPAHFKRKIWETTVCAYYYVQERTFAWP